MQARFFYHNFPRRGGANPIEKGLAILESLATSGLLLTPERTLWYEFREDGTRSEPIEVFQKRACFTELATEEVEQHSRQFGPFAIEFEVESLRLLGAIPVFYLPTPGTNERALGGIAGALVARMADVQQVLTRLAEIERLVAATPNKQELINLTRNGRPAGSTRATVGAAEDLLAILSHQSQPFEQLLAAFRALANFFYPTENFKFTGELAYYRQREWRIISAMTHRRQEITRALTADEMGKLLELDAEYFSRRMRFPSGEFRLVDQCRYLTEVDQAPFLTWARRIVAPDEMVSAASELLRRYGCQTPVVGAVSMRERGAA